MKKYIAFVLLLALPILASAQLSTPEQLRAQRAENQSEVQRNQSELSDFKMTVVRFTEAVVDADKASIAILKKDLVERMERELAQAKKSDAKSATTTRIQEMLTAFKAKDFTNTGGKQPAEMKLLHEFMQAMEANL